mgnify:CR=1 FL=1|jgi:ribosome biogenesis SPOUT family RNA methylase Rps3
MSLPVIEVVNIVENEDGTANVELELDVEAVRLLLQEGFISILKTHIEEQERKKNDKI